MTECRNRKKSFKSEYPFIEMDVLFKPKLDTKIVPGADVKKQISIASYTIPHWNKGQNQPKKRAFFWNQKFFSQLFKRKNCCLIRKLIQWYYFKRPRMDNFDERNTPFATSFKNDFLTLNVIKLYKYCGLLHILNYQVYWFECRWHSWDVPSDVLLFQ